LLLPNATGQVAQNKSITVLVSADLQYLVNNEKVGFSGLKSKLSAEINKAKSKTDKPSVILKIDKSVALEKVVDVLQIGNELKVPMILSTKPKK
jgi:biopolymer transport protein ExbD